MTGRRMKLDELEGRDEFLRRYGFGRARAYLLEVDGKLYDSKAIVGYAHSVDQGELLAAAERWRQRGIVEPAVVTALRRLAEHPAWLDLSGTWFGVLGAAFGLGFIVGSQVGPRVLQRFRPATVIAGGLTMAAIGLAMLTQVSAYSGLALVVVGSLSARLFRFSTWSLVKILTIALLLLD